MTDERKYSVYCHTCPDGKKYIGLTGKSPEKRWLNGRGYQYNLHFTRAIRKYGWDNIAHEVLSTGLTAREAKDEEKRLIALYDTTDQRKGYNLTHGGDGANTLTDAARKRLSESAKEAYRKGRVPTMLGKHFSAESRRKMSEAAHRRVLSEEHKRHIGESVKGLMVGGKNPMARSVLCIETGEIFSSVKEAADSIGTTRNNVSRCVTGRNKTAGGFHWKYLNEEDKGLIMCNIMKLTEFRQNRSRV